MRNRDWTLVLFTTISQWSVGIVWCFTWLVYIENDTRILMQTGFTLNNPVLLALVSVGLATIISFSHLGQPSNAPKSMNNLAGSWVSREILALAAYSISLSVVFVLAWRNWHFEYLNDLLVVCCVFGLMFIWMMTRIYIIPTIPPWNSWYTGLSFISTSICLGLITILFLRYDPGCINCDVGCVTCYTRFTDDQTSKTLLFYLIVILLIEIVSSLVHQSRLQKMNTGIDDLVLNKGTFFRVFLIRMLMLILALLASFAFLFLATLFVESGYFIWVCSLLVLLVAQEFTGRLLFYSSYFRIGV